MEICRIVLMILLVILCTGSSYTDCMYGKVYNKFLLPHLILGILLNGIILFADGFSLINIYFLNIGVLAIIALVMFYTHIWAGGDAKLLIVIAIIYPICDYFEVNGNTVTLWMLLVATFSIGFLFIIIDSALQIGKYHRYVNKNGLISSVRKMIWGYIQNISYIVAFSHLYHFFFESIVNIPSSLYFFICLLLVFVLQRVKILQEKSSIFSIIVFDIIMAMMTSFVPINQDIRYYILIFCFMIIRAIASQYNYQVIDTDQIKKGMILSHIDTIIMGQSRIQGLPGISDETLASRLTEQEVLCIKRWRNSKMGKPTLTIVRKIPFALFISLGAFFYLLIEVFI